MALHRVHGAPSVRVLVPQRVEGVRVAGQDPLEVAARDRLRCSPRRALPEQPLLTRAADVVARRALGVVEDPEVDARPRAAGARAPRVRAGCAGRRMRSRRRTRARSAGSLRVSFTSKSSSLAQRARLRCGSPNELPLVVIASNTCWSIGVQVARLDQAAAQLVDDRHVLDADRADLDAGHALHAGPERLRTRSGRRGSSALRDRARRSATSRRSSTRSRGESGSPAAVAGQASWHLPHCVQASSRARCRGRKSAIRRVADLRRLASGGIAAVASRPVVAHGDAAGPGQHVQRLRVRDRRRRTTARRRRAPTTSRAASSRPRRRRARPRAGRCATRPAERRPASRTTAGRLRDPQRLEQEPATGRGRTARRGTPSRRSCSASVRLGPARVVEAHGRERLTARRRARPRARRRTRRGTSE